MKQIIVNNLLVELEKKRIKNLYLRILPPEGRIHISAPNKMSEVEIIRFVQSKIDWIIAQQEKVQLSHTQKIPTNYVTGDEIYIWGRKYLLSVFELTGRPKISFEGEKILMYVREGSTTEKRKQLLDAYYKEVLIKEIPNLIEKWEKTIGVKSSDYSIRDMKTRWGTCNIRTKKICLSLQLAKKPPECVEYVVVHELVHLLEGSHNKIFKGYLDHFLPEWRSIKKEMNKEIMS